jgi:hypothetical protein
MRHTTNEATHVQEMASTRGPIRRQAGKRERLMDTTSWVDEAFPAFFSRARRGLLPDVPVCVTFNGSHFTLSMKSEP